VFENYAIEKVKHDDIRDGMDAGLCGDRWSQWKYKNIKVKKFTNGKRIDGIIAAIMALGGSFRQKKNNKYSKKWIKDIYI
jgi:hypothetical protein